MLHKAVSRTLNSTASIRYPHSLTSFCSTISFAASRFFSVESATKNNNSPETRDSELTRVRSLVEGCDYEHWLVVMKAPKGYPLRDEIVKGYVKTLTMALGSEEEANKSIYSVSTKYYYGFGCKVPENLAFKIKLLPDVKWVLPDSYLSHGENSYGGEPFVNGELAPYDDKYHEDWLRDKAGEDTSISPRKKTRRKRKKKSSSEQTRSC